MNHPSNLVQISADVLKTLRSESITGTQYAVLFYLLEACQSGEVAEVSSEAIAAELGVNQRTVIRAVKRLEELNIFDTELISARWNVRLNPTLIFYGQRDPRFGQNDPLPGQNDPLPGQNDPLPGQNDPRSGSICQKTERKTKRSGDFPQKRSGETVERDLYSDLKDQEISLSEGESIAEILEFILRENPKAQTPAYARKALKCDGGFWINRYRRWKAGEEEEKPVGSSPGYIPTASSQFLKTQITAVYAAAVAAGDLDRFRWAIDTLKRDNPPVYAELLAEHPEWFSRE